MSKSDSLSLKLNHLENVLTMAIGKNKKVLKYVFLTILNPPDLLTASVRLDTVYLLK